MTKDNKQLSFSSHKTLHEKKESFNHLARIIARLAANGKEQNPEVLKRFNELDKELHNLVKRK